MIEHELARYLHCVKCMSDLPENEVPQTYARLNVAALPDGGLLVECIRHDEVVAEIPGHELVETMRDLGNATCMCGSHHEEDDHAEGVPDDDGPSPGLEVDDKGETAVYRPGTGEPGGEGEGGP